MTKEKKRDHVFLFLYKYETALVFFFSLFFFFLILFNLFDPLLTFFLSADPLLTFFLSATTNMPRSKVYKAKKLQPARLPAIEKRLKLVLPPSFPVTQNHIAFMTDLVLNKDKYDEDIGTMISRALLCRGAKNLLMERILEGYFNGEENYVYQELLTIIIRHDHGHNSDVWSWICTGLCRLIKHEAFWCSPGPVFRGLGKLMTLVCDLRTHFEDADFALLGLHLNLLKVLLEYGSVRKEHLLALDQALEIIAVFGKK
jgi:hypothetical protein